MANPKNLKVTLIKGLAGKPKWQFLNARGLGLNKTHSSSVLKDTPEVRGMIRKIQFLLKVEQA